ncbi:hypothetical protein [Kaarinaea lacus]
MAILSQAGSTLPEGAETTWELIVLVCKIMRSSVLNNRQERPAPWQSATLVVGDEIVHSHQK